MSRSLPAAVLPNLLAPETDEAYIVLLDIDHDTGTIKICNNSVNLDPTGSSTTYWTQVSGGGHWDLADGSGYDWKLQGLSPSSETYNAVPFTIVLPHEIEGQMSEASLILDNVSRFLVDEIRSQENPLEVTITVIQASDYEVLVTYPPFEAKDLTYDAVSITMKLSLENFLGEPFPEGVFSGKDFPGLF